MRNKKKYCFGLILAMLLLCIGVAFAISFQSSAAGGAVNSNIDAFKQLQGEAGYIKNADNYYLDMEETDWLETGQWLMNKIANMLFTFIKWLASVVVTLFYQCMTFDMSELFKDQINGIQKTLNNGIFQPLFLLGFCGSAIILIKKMLRRDLMGAYGQILKVIGIVILSLLVVRDSATVLSAATGVTKSISAQALVGMQGDTAATDFAANSAGVLWVNLIHQPWKFIEFGSDPVTDEEVKEFLTTEINDRKELVKEHNGSAFDKDRAGERIGFMFLYLIPFVIKSLVYIVMALMTLVFQLIAIFYVILAPVVLILAMIPGYEGMLTSWLRKILESQLSILIMSFIIGLLVKVDQMLFDMCAVEWGWLVVMIVQTVLAVFVIVKKDQLIGVMSKLQKGAANPGFAKSMMMRGLDGYSLANQGAKNTVKAAIATGQATGQVAIAAGRKIKSYGQAVAGLGSIRETAIMEAAGSYEWKYPKKAKNVCKAEERPRMSQYAEGGANRTVGKEQGHSTGSVGMRGRMNAYQTAPEPHTEVVRPRMDNSGINNKVVQFAHAEEQRERITRRATVVSYQDRAGQREVPPVKEQKTERNGQKRPTQGRAEEPAVNVKEHTADRIRGQKTEVAPVQRPKSSVWSK